MSEWPTCPIDFSSAFLHAQLDYDVWMTLPKGFKSEQGPNRCLKLEKSLYGLAVAPKLWFECLLEALKEEGFVQSQHDQCLLCEKDMIMVCYVDDCGIGAKNESDIDAHVDRLRAKGFEITKEGTSSEFLGIKFDSQSDGPVHLTQKGLIKKVLSTTGLEDSNPNWTPATVVGLGSDPKGEPFKERWGYSSVVGMLIYLATNTRMDIAFAVSQVARFSHAPKQSHGTAVKTIVRHLNGTRDKGTIVRLEQSLALDCYVDADFAGLYGREPDTDPVAAKSRTGCTISLAGCPLIWKSQLQSAVALSTLEAEYAALSAATRVLLPIRAMIEEAGQALGLPYTLTSTVRARVFEDNNGALLLATNQRLTNRTKYFLVKWHHFWSEVQDGTIEAKKVSTDLETR